MILLPALETRVGFNTVYKQASDKPLIDLSSRRIKPCREAVTWRLIPQPWRGTASRARSNSLTSTISTALIYLFSTPRTAGHHSARHGDSQDVASEQTSHFLLKPVQRLSLADKFTG